MRHRRVTCASLQKLGQGLMFIDGAVSINPTQSCYDDTLLRVSSKTSILVFTGHQRGRRAGGRVSSPCIEFRARQASLTSRKNLRRCPLVKPPEYHASSSLLASKPRGGLCSAGARRAVALPSVETSLRRARPSASPALLSSSLALITMTNGTATKTSNPNCSDYPGLAPDASVFAVARRCSSSASSRLRRLAYERISGGTRSREELLPEKCFCTGTVGGVGLVRKGLGMLL